MGFKQLRQALDLSGEEAAPVAIDYTEVKQVTSDMLTEDSFFHFEILGTVPYRTHHRFCMGDRRSALREGRTDIGLLQTPIFKISRKTPLKVYDFKRAKVLLSHLGVPFKIPRLTVDWPSISCRP